jgi:pimeloyl-ACP methyl ester carboxylesterase
LADLQLPSLVLHGDQDPVAPVANARMLAERLPDAALEIVSGAGHMLLFDESDKAAAIVEPFLAA